MARLRGKIEELEGEVRSIRGQDTTAIRVSGEEGDADHLAHMIKKLKKRIKMRDKETLTRISSFPPPLPLSPP